MRDDYNVRDLEGKVAIVTGASRGVGKGIAIALGKAGATVYVTGRSVEGKPTTDNFPCTIEETARQVTASGGEGIAICCDHTDDAQVEDLFRRVMEEQGQLDILVNNVWGGYEGDTQDGYSAPFWSEQDFIHRWRLMFDAGVRAHYTASYLAVRDIKQEGGPLNLMGEGGLIVNISYGKKNEEGEPTGQYQGNVLYDVSKTATDRLAICIAEALCKKKIAVVSLHPGLVKTEFVVRLFEKNRSELPDDIESPQYTGRAVAELAADPNVMELSGKIWTVNDLAVKYGF